MKPGLNESPNQPAGFEGTGSSTVRIGPPQSNLYPFLRPPRQEGDLGQLGNYRVVRLLGSGGTGYIFHAEDIDLQRPVALKVLKRHLCQEAEGLQRFLREARIMAAIQHDHLVTLYQAGNEGQTAFLAMELLQGDTLDGWMRRNRQRPVGEILRVAREIVSGLVVIHHHGIVHRDIKPANLWRCSPSEKIKILDFGLASCIQDDPGLTRTGTIMGTPSYMSPEQARGEKVDAMSDLFSLGSVLYCLCTGRTPFRDDNTMAALAALASETPRPVHMVNPAIPRALSDLIGQLMAKIPAQRPSSAVAVLDWLRQMGTGPATQWTAPEPEPKVRVIRSGKEPPSKGGRWRTAVALASVSAAVFAVTQFGSGLAGVLSAAFPKGSENAGSAEANTPRGAAESWPLEPPGVWKRGPAMEIPAGFPAFADACGFMEVRGRICQKGPSGQIPLQPMECNGQNLSYRLGRQYSGCAVDVSIHSEPASPESPLLFYMFGDGKLLWKSQALKGSAQRNLVSIKGVDVLRMEVQPTGPFRGKHTVTIDAVVGR
jgi:eukaryotic-like serine/threonine-protein kinase